MIASHITSAHADAFTGCNQCEQQRNRLCAIAPSVWEFRLSSPYRYGRDCGTPKPRKKKQKRYDYACAVLIFHRFPFSFSPNFFRTL